MDTVKCLVPLYSTVGVVISPRKALYPQLISDRLRLVLTLRAPPTMYSVTGIGYSDVDIFKKMEEGHRSVKKKI